MTEDLWDDGERQHISDLERGLELAEESLETVAFGVNQMYDETVNGRVRSEEMLNGFFATGIGSAGFALAPFLASGEWIFNGFANRIDNPGYTVSNGVYSEGEIDQKVGRVFYTEGDERYVTVAPPVREEIDTELVTETVEYLDDFQA